MLLRVSASSACRRGGIGCCSLPAASEAAAGVLVVLVVDCKLTALYALGASHDTSHIYYSADVALRAERGVRSASDALAARARSRFASVLLACRAPLSLRRTAACARGLLLCA